LELNWSTFLLEIINFLVLVWILKRFLYKPVLKVIHQRHARIENRIAEAQQLHEEADTLKVQYEERLTEWEQECQQSRENLHQEIEAERARLMEELQISLDQEREKTRIIEQRKLAEALHTNEQTALAHGAQFAAKLLLHAAGPEMEKRLINLFVEELPRLPITRQEELRCACAEVTTPIIIVSAYEMDDKQRAQLENALRPIIGDAITCHYEQDSILISGVRITIGSWVVHANLQDELKEFAELSYAQERK